MLTNDDKMTFLKLKFVGSHFKRFSFYCFYSDLDINENQILDFSRCVSAPLSHVDTTPAHPLSLGAVLCQNDPKVKGQLQGLKQRGKRASV